MATVVLRNTRPTIPILLRALRVFCPFDPSSQISTKIHVGVFVDDVLQFKTEVSCLPHSTWHFTSPVKLFTFPASVVCFCIYQESLVGNLVIGQLDGRLASYIDCATNHRLASKSFPGSTLQVTLDVDYGEMSQDPAMRLCYETLAQFQDSNSKTRHYPRLLSRAIQDISGIMGCLRHTDEVYALSGLARVLLMWLHMLPTYMESYYLKPLVEGISNSLALIRQLQAHVRTIEADAISKDVLRLVIETIGFVDEWLYVRGSDTVGGNIQNYARKLHKLQVLMSGMIEVKIAQTQTSPQVDEIKQLLERLQSFVSLFAHVTRELPYAGVTASQQSDSIQLVVEIPLGIFEAKRCAEIVSMIMLHSLETLRTRDRFLLPQHNIEHCIEAAREVTIELSSFIMSVEVASTDTEVPTELLEEAALPLLELVNKALIHISRSERSSGFWKNMNKIRVILCEYSCRLPESILLDSVDVKQNVSGLGANADIHEGTYRDGQVAIKRLRFFSHSQHHTSQDQRKLLKKFYREIAIQYGSRHENICHVIGVGREREMLCPVLPWFRNGQITSFLETSGFDPIKVHRMLVEISDGLHYLHQEDIAHGDLHPGNILIDDDEHIKLSDFGISKFSDPQWNEGTSRTGAVAYMAPEILDFARYKLDRIRHTPQSDVYSFGHVCWKIFTNRNPFAGLSMHGIILSIVEGRLPARPKLDGPRHIDDGLWHLMQKCWMGLPQERTTAAKLGHDLRALARSLHGTEVPYPESENVAVEYDTRA